VFAIVIGQTALADAYNGANNSPNAIYELLLGGVLSASLVPLFTKQAEERDDDATSAVITVSVIALTALTALAIVAAPWIFRLFSIDVADGIDPQRYRAAGTALARIFLVQIFFYGLTALTTALLQARRRFFAAAWAPVLSNVVIIASLLLVPSAVDGREPQLAEVLTNARLQWTLGLGATVGIAVMALAMIPALRAADVSIQWRPEPKHPAVRRLLKLSVWTLATSSRTRSPSSSSRTSPDQEVAASMRTRRRTSSSSSPTGCSRCRSSRRSRRSSRAACSGATVGRSSIARRSGSG
jgi:putative peptidoglycan lipid II flippase